MDKEFYEIMSKLQDTKERELLASLSLDEVMFINENFTIDSMGYIQCPIQNVTDKNRKGLEALLAKEVTTFNTDVKFGGYTIFNNHIKNLIS